MWERQTEEVIPSGRSGENKGVEIVRRIPVFARIKTISRVVSSS